MHKIRKAKRTIKPYNGEPVVRFWIYHNGDHIKITLRHRQSIEVGEWWATEEGYGDTYEKYTFDATYKWIELKSYKGGADCDGEIGDEFEGFAECEKLPPRHAMLTPTFTPIFTRHHDEYAERAGY